MNPLITDWMQAWSSIITGFLGLTGAAFALCQIFQIKEQLMGSTLTNVLSLEADMNSRKAKLDDINNDIEKANKEGQLHDAMKEIFS